ncbi:GTP cyclohydrolase I FolE [Anaerolentibacter hominis]|uniref:GTP cyclohydrolase I FolE n=1 Tax=Anaerolentibacter hominis TaxID=3079009 RepID=UPI0031B8A886
MIDKNKIETAVRLFLEGIGEDIERPGLQETPKRISTMCEELFAGMEDDSRVHLSKTFPAENNEMVLERDITFYSVCEHHLLPFFGKVHIAYIPDEQVVGISKLARTVEVYARRAQIQEQMTAQIADAVMEYLKPKGVMVMVEAEHLCMSMRGIKKPGTRTVTFVCRGEFEHNRDLTDTFFRLTGGTSFR